ncbi:MAG: TPM domain-containing protein [Prolixibacteraceae bacterium]|nr:TPM domain-containing protein [Prolixibacteraceae bacterium]
MGVNISAFFTKEQKAEIEQAIRTAEVNTSGEVRVHIETKCNESELDRAAWWFAELKMHKTELRNGVLFYMALEDKKFAIIGDIGINKVVGADFWDETKELVLGFFKQGKYTQGLTVGIIQAGLQLQKHFPYKKEDINELTDEISFGK